jgi:hypothetical protein
MDATMSERPKRSSTIPRNVLRLAAAALIYLSACGGRTAQLDAMPGNDAEGGSGSVAAACTWPAGVGHADPAGRWDSTAARYFLSCADGAGNEKCLSSDPSACVGPNTIPGTDCVSQCKADEYAVNAWQVGGYTLPPTPVLPEGCRSINATPGVAYWCCPCQ